ncbi:MAG: hypothetical protein HQM08_09345 [Candidatus Riflebacteria bacterium]|nr:hypothetical protein [Candidatus Riflebacteria bacterium]
MCQRKVELSDLNVLIGANGAGKSNFVSFFTRLRELVEQRLQFWVSKNGAAERILSQGLKETSQIDSSIWFESIGYDFTLTPTIEGGFTFAREEFT